jgi:hypothetical protein
MKFPLGQVVATPGALAAFEASGDQPLALLSRHVQGDWGELSPEDIAENELSLREGFRLLSAYKLSNGERIFGSSQKATAPAPACFCRRSTDDQSATFPSPRLNAPAYAPSSSPTPSYRSRRRS